MTNKSNHKEDFNYYLAFSHCLGIGPLKFAQLLASYKNVKKAYEAPIKEIEALLGPAFSRNFAQFRAEFDPINKADELKRKQINVLTIEDQRYPLCLKNIPDPPICLYIKGQVEEFDFEDDFFFAVVGTRRPSSYGQQIARLFSQQLSQAGAVIVSGMAMGIDTSAHWSALDAGAKTIAVLGCGVDIVYPPQNNKLYEKIIASKSMVISEFPPGHLVRPGLFIARNRLISGLSKGVLVVEGTSKSGSLATARYAALQGKEVFAPPVPLTSDLSEAPNILLKQGANFVTCPEDILEYFHLASSQQLKKKKELPKEERIIYDFLMTQPMNMDELAITLKLSIANLLPLISAMEIEGIIEKNYEGNYQIKV